MYLKVVGYFEDGHYQTYMLECSDYMISNIGIRLFIDDDPKREIHIDKYENVEIFAMGSNGKTFDRYSWQKETKKAS